MSHIYIYIYMDSALKPQDSCTTQWKQLDVFPNYALLRDVVLDARMGEKNSQMRNFGSAPISDRKADGRSRILMQSISKPETLVECRVTGSTREMARLIG